MLGQGKGVGVGVGDRQVFLIEISYLSFLQGFLSIPQCFAIIDYHFTSFY